MEKWLCWGSLGIAGLLLIVFVLDLALGILFNKTQPVVDILVIVCCALVGYLAWDALSDQR